jgi:hypothetical protein
MNTGIDAINQAVQEAGAFVRPLFNELSKVIIGQTYLVERLVIGLLANGHVLLEGVPGWQKLGGQITGRLFECQIFPPPVHTECCPRM